MEKLSLSDNIVDIMRNLCLTYKIIVKAKTLKFNILSMRLAVVLGLISAGSICYSQTGPGGVGTIDGTSSLKLWLRADKNVSYDNLKKIISWTDYSGNNIVLTSSGTAPLFASNSLNGMPVVNFNSDQAGLVKTGVQGSNLFSASKNTIIFVKQSVSGAYWLNWQSAPANQVSFSLSSGKEVYNFPDNTSGQLISSGSVNGAYNILSNRTDGTNQAIFLNGVQDATKANSLTLTTSASSNIYLGNYDGTDINGWTGYIAECVIFNTDLNSAQRTLVENYLSAKYSITISNDHYAGDNSGNGNYDYDIAGIGAETDGKNSVTNSAGVHLSENAASLAAGEYLIAGHANQVQNLTTSDVTGSVTLRWNRNWYIDKTGTVDAKISFDFSEGINGGTPGGTANYVLLYRAGTSGNFSPVAGVSAAIENTDQVYFNVTNANLVSGFYTLGTTSATDSPLDGIKTWYNYSVDNNDNWDNWARWTLDPDGTSLINTYHLTPGASDNVVILNGGTVNITGVVAKAAATIEIRSGGILNISDASPKPTFTEIIGAGRFILSANNYPGNGTNDSDFKTKGTVEYSGAGYSLSTALSYYNLVINLTSSGSIVTLKSNLTVGNDFTIQQGIFQINDSANNVKYTVNIARNVSIQSNGQITTGTGDPTNGAYSYGVTMPGSGHFHDIYHEFNVTGDFTNFGTVKFTNLTVPVYNNFATDGAVSLKFTGANNNNINLYGPVTFYNLIIDKGTSQSNIASVYSADSAYFNLFGGNAAARNVTAPFDTANPEVRKALFIKNGTLKLTGNIYIYTLSEGGIAGTNGDYAIGANACLWLAGPHVTVYSTANSTGQAPAGAFGVNTGTSDQGISVSGRLRISDGTFGSHNSSGIIYQPRYSGMIQIEGGLVNVSQIHSTTDGTGKSIFYQSGGNLIIRGAKTEAGNIDNAYPLFALVNATDNFQMSGGNMSLYDISGGTSYGNNAFYINSDPGNYDVTSGTINVQVDGGVNCKLFSKASLWNLNVQRYNATGTATLLLGRDLVVLNDILIFDNAQLDPSPDAGTTNYNLNIGRNFTIGSTAGSTSLYVNRNNVTTFDGNNNSIVNVFNNTDVTTYVFSPYDLVINKNSTSATLTIESSLRTANPVANIRRNFTITAGKFDYATFTVDVKGNLNNNGIMGIWDKTGRIRLNNTGAQQTITGSTGAGVLFGHVEVAHTDGSANNVQLNSNASCDLFTLTSGRVYIQNYRLSVDTNFVTFTAAGTPSNRMIEAMADHANRGLKFKMNYNYNAPKTITFPVGTYDGTNHYWAKCDVSIAATVGNVSGYLTIIPIPFEHPAKAGGGCTNLAYYWKALSSGLSGTTGGVQYAFSSPLADPGGGTKEYYLLNGGTWTADAAYSSTLTFEAAKINGFATGDFTAGKNACFNAVNYVYSNGTGGGVWNAATSWVGGIPSTSDYTVIRSGDIITANSGADDAGTVVINAGGTLDVGTVTGLSYGVISGGGKFRIASNTANVTPTLPTGDFDPFLLNDTATFEYYGAASYRLPPTITYYPTLKIGCGAGGGTIKTLPAVNITIYKDLLIYDDIQTGVTLALNNSGTSGYDLTVKGSIKFDREGVFRFPAAGAVRNVTVEKSIELNTNSNTAINKLEIQDSTGTYGSFHSLTVMGDIKRNPNDSVLLYRNKSNRRAVNLTFTGSNNSQITTANSTTKLNNLTVNKDLGTNELLINSNIAFTDNNDRPVTLTKGHLIFDNTNINISLTSADGNFTIPANGKLSLRNGARANITGVTTGLILDGALSVENNSQMLVNDGTNDNYIEYSSTGTSSISVSGTATLTVGSQIRRKTTSEAGTLLYSQTGGTVTAGNSQAPTGGRAIFEVFKPGGSFTFTGGNLIIVRAQSTTAPAIYIDPATYSLSGGATLTFGNANTPPSSNIGLYSTIPLKDIIVSNSGGTKTVKLYTSGITADSVNINTGQAFDANSLDLGLNGNLHNLGTFTSGTNTTSFTGSKQKIIGKTTFNNLTINTTDSVVLRNNIIVNGNLAIASGKFSDCADTIDLRGDFSNNGTQYSYSNSIGGILFSGTKRQKISGTGVFGRLNINNIYGAELQNSFSLVDRNINLTNGCLYIRQYKIQLGQQASVTTTGSFSKDKMIVTNGAISDLGVERAISSGTTSDIIIPIGVNGKYTPVKVSQLDVIGNGYITVRPVNNYHPTVLDSTNVLQYYWNLQTSGFSTFKGTLGFYYSQSDVAVKSPNIESDYIPAYLNGSSWAKFDSKNIDAISNIVDFNFNSGDNLNGDFTAGISAAIPDVVPTFYTINNGDWENKDIWAREDALPVTAFPTGYIVKIRNNVTTKYDLKYAYKTIIESGGTLNIGTTIGHYLGQVSGIGMLSVSSSRLPAGNYDNFFTCSGGIMEFGGSGTYEIPDKGTTYRSLILSGSGTKTLAYKDLTICESFLINGPVVDNSTHNNKITLNGSFTLQSGAFKSGTGPNATLVFGGTAGQTLTGNFTGSDKLNNITINNAGGLTLAGNVTMAGILTLTNGVITTGANTFKMEVASTATPATGTSTSYIAGPLSKVLANGSNFTFPIGKSNRNGMFTGTNISTVGELNWKVEYFNTGAPSKMNLGTGISAVSDEYWKVTPPAGTSPVTLRWDASSSINGLSAGGMSNIRLVQYDTAATRKWISQAATIGGSSTNTDGTITTNSAISFTSGTPAFFALASTATLLPSANFISANSTICSGSSVGLQINLTNGTGWKLIYNDGSNHTVKPGSSPFTLTVSPVSTTTYTLVSVLNQDSISGTASGSVTVTVNPTPNVTITNPAAVCSPSTVDLTAAAVTAGSTPGLTFTYWTDAGATVVYGSPATAVGGTYYIKGTTAAGCFQVKPVVATVTPLPTASISYSGSPWCSAAGIQNVTLTGTPGGTYSAPAGLTINLVTGAITPSSSTPGTYTVTYTIAAAGGCGIVTATTSITITAYVFWTGTVSSDWSVPGNWCSGSVPDGTGYIRIPSPVGNYPVISAGNVTINGTLEIIDGATLTLNTGPVLTLQAGATITTGSTGKIILESDSRYLNLSTSTPRLQIKRLLSAVVKGWRMVASPVSTTFSDMFASPLVTQGFTGSGFPSLQPNLLWWNETDGGTPLQSWRTPATFGSNITGGLGYFMYIFNGALKPTPPGGGNYSDALPFTMSATGTEYFNGSGSYSFTISKTPRSSGSPTKYIDVAGEGWNLIGNPTASTIDWDAAAGWTKTNMDNSIYIWDPTANSNNGDYKFWNKDSTSSTLSSGRIVPFQAFWVHANGAAPVLSLTNSVKTSTSGSFLKKGIIKTNNDDYLYSAKSVVVPLTLEGLDMKSSSFIKLGEDYIIGPDKGDVYRLEPMSNTWLALYMNSSLNRKEPLVVNTLPLDTAQTLIIPVYTSASIEGKPAGGDMTLTWKIPVNWPSDLVIELMDHEKQKAVSMLETDNYKFTLVQSKLKSASLQSVNPLDIPNEIVILSETLSGTKGTSSVSTPFSIVIRKGISEQKPTYEKLEAGLLPMSPNPFSNFTRLAFRLPEEALVHIDIFDMYGRRLDNPLEGVYPAGLNEIIWTPKKHFTGMFIVRFTSGLTVETQRGIRIE
jgi:hypothetical protein